MLVLNGLVSVLHHKYRHGNSRLDLGYITPRLIASAEPSDSFFKQQYRTSAADLAQFLTDRHGRYWHVWNLQEDSELSYSPTQFGKDVISGPAVTRYPTRDHGPMRFSELIALVREISAFLRRDRRNVALVHCKCGKGRTGMVACAYLMAAHGDSDTEANREFTRKRIRYSVVWGVSINSQLRYLRYANEFFGDGQDPAFLRRRLVRIVAVSVRYPQHKNFLITLDGLPSSQVPFDPSQETGTPLRAAQSWNVVTRSHFLTVMCPAGEVAVLPADITCEYTGYNNSGGTSRVRFSFNTSFEALNPDNRVHDRPPSVFTGASTPPPYGRHAMSWDALDTGIHRFHCEWEMADGRYGTPWLGPRLFDFVEILWKDYEEEVLSVV